MNPSRFLRSLFSLEGKSAIVTGAARGNGRAIAEALLGAGAAVMLVDRLEEELGQLKEQFARQGMRVSFTVCDLVQPTAAGHVVNETIAAFGRVDVLVNNAGISLPHETLAYPDDAWRATMSINLEAPFRLARAAAVAMRQNGGGCIINISSLNAELAFPDNPAYVASKGGLRQLGRALALDLAPFNIRVNNLGPGYIRTEMTKGSWDDPVRREQRVAHVPLGRWGQPEDLAGAVVFLASDASAYVTGQDIYVDGGWLVKGL